jgi:hypothetical protein
MFSPRFRKLMLALVLVPITACYSHASGVSRTSTGHYVATANDGPTGTDPEPTGPDVAHVILMLWQLSIE